MHMWLKIPLHAQAKSKCRMLLSCLVNFRGTKMQCCSLIAPKLNTSLKHSPAQCKA
jgi:hypothetical protein